MEYVDVVSCLWFLFNSKILLFIYHRHPRPTARLLKFLMSKNYGECISILAGCSALAQTRYLARHNAY